MRVQELDVRGSRLRALELERARDDAVEIVRRALEDALGPRDEAVDGDVRTEVRGEVVRGERLRRRLEPWKRVSGKNRLGLGRRARAAAYEREENQ